MITTAKKMSLPYKQAESKHPIDNTQFGIYFFVPLMKFDEDRYDYRFIDEAYVTKILSDE